MIQNYTHDSDPIEQEQYNVTYVNLELDFDMAQLEIYEPIISDLQNLQTIFDKLRETKEFDGILMVASNRDKVGNNLKMSMEFLGELQQYTQLQNIKMPPSHLAILNFEKESNKTFSTKIFKTQNSHISDAIKYSRNNLKCGATEIQYLNTERVYNEQIDKAFHKLIHKIEYKRQILNTTLNKRSQIRNFGSKIKTYVSQMDKIKRLNLIFQGLVVLQYVKIDLLNEHLYS
eukprot:403359780